MLEKVRGNEYFSLMTQQESLPGKDNIGDQLPKHENIWPNEDRSRNIPDEKNLAEVLL